LDLIIIYNASKFVPGRVINPLNAELNTICYLLALLAHHFLFVSRISVKSLTLRLLRSYVYIYIYIYDISSLRVKTYEKSDDIHPQILNLGIR